MPHDRRVGARPRDLGVLALIAVGGMLGASARYALGRLMPVHAGRFPWATFSANLAGSFALGFAGVLIRHWYPTGRRTRAFVATGVIGAFTTMSSLQVETALLVADDKALTGVLYAVSTLVCGLALAAFGVGVGRLVAEGPVRKERR